MHLARHRLRLVAGLAAVATLGTAGLGYAVVGADLSLNGAARQNGPDRSAEVAAAINPGKAKNVILLIGDGMGDSEITSARNYAEGAAGRFKGIDALPLTGQYTTYSLQRGTKIPDYVPDSSATGSAWSTGTKTYDNAVSVDTNGVPQKTILELAKEAGLKTGDVTTSELQDATPAVLVSHISQRGCYGPNNTKAYAVGDPAQPEPTKYCPEADLSKGGALGLGSITEQLLATRPDVTFGGGAATFGQSATAGTYSGKTLFQQAAERGYQVLGSAAAVGTRAQLDAVTSADQTKPVLGLFATGNMPVRYTGPAATLGGDKLPVGGLAAVPTCADNVARPATQPKLAEMTTKAISLLDNPKGFFLQVEGASIDKQDHSSDACGQIGEVVDLDEAVQVALAFAKKDGNTSVFVTADHAHTSQIVEVVPTTGTSSTPGKTTLVKTADGTAMAISYATSTGGSQQHTGSQLRIAGYGPKAANIVGLTDQTDLFFTMKDALFGPPTTTPPVVVPPALSSVGASVKVVPGKIRRGGVAVVVGQGFRADTSVKVTIKGNGKTRATTKAVSGGTVVLTLRGAKVGTAKVTVTGVQSGVSDKARLQIKK